MAGSGRIRSPWVPPHRACAGESDQLPVKFVTGLAARLGDTKALTISPATGSGLPITPASATAGCSISTLSTSKGPMRCPADLITSSARAARARTGTSHGHPLPSVRARLAAGHVHGLTQLSVATLVCRTEPRECSPDARRSTPGPMTHDQSPGEPTQPGPPRPGPRRPEPVEPPVPAPPPGPVPPLPQPVPPPAPPPEPGPQPRPLPPPEPEPEPEPAPPRPRPYPDPLPEASAGPSPRR